MDGRAGQWGRMGEALAATRVSKGSRGEGGAENKERSTFRETPPTEAAEFAGECNRMCTEEKRQRTGVEKK